MAYFRKRPSGQWQASIRKAGYPAQSKTFDKKSDAEAWAIKIENEINRGVFQSTDVAERTTLSDVIKQFATEYAPENYRVREDGKEAWRYQLAHLNTHLGDYSLAALDRKVIEAYKQKRMTTAYVNPTMKPIQNPSPELIKRRADILRRKAEKLALDKKNGVTKKEEPPKPPKFVGASTVRKEIFMLSKLMKFAKKSDIHLPRGNPVESVDIPKEGKGRERRLTEIEFAELDAQIQKSRNKLLAPAFHFAIETAARQGEILNLTWEHVHIEDQYALLKITKNGEERAAPLSKRAIEILESLYKRGTPKEAKVFGMDRSCLASVFEYACNRAKIEDYTWHDLRHEALSRLTEKGDFSILELASISGHKTLQMLKKYTHLQAKKLADKMG